MVHRLGVATARVMTYDYRVAAGTVILVKPSRSRRTPGIVPPRPGIAGIVSSLVTRFGMRHHDYTRPFLLRLGTVGIVTAC